ncbi:type IV fimbrial biogenesis protein FimT [Marinobacterium sp. MBR-109]
MMNARTHCQGFSVVELMVTIAVLAIIVGIGLPSFQSMMERSRLDSAADTLADSFRYARSEAITRNTTVDVDGSYAGGWAVKVGNTDLRVYKAFHTQVGIDNDTAVSFNGRGMANSAQDFELDYNDGIKRCVALLLSGAVRQTNGGCE